jgi:hypothetical protein
VSSTSNDPNAANDDSSATTTVVAPSSPLRFEIGRFEARIEPRATPGI